MKEFIKKIAIASIRFRINTLAVTSPERASKLAWKTFGTPRKGKLRPHDIEFLKGADWHTLQHDDSITIQCYEWKGEGQKILLAHGWESNSARWMKLISFLRKRNAHIICMDAPAHGGSGGNIFDAGIYSETMRTVVEYFQPQHIIGHSVGGFAATMFLSKHPNHLEKAIILGVPSELPEILEKFSSFIGLSKRAKKAMFEGAIPRFGFPVEYATVKNNFAKKLEIKGLVIHDEDDFVAPCIDGKEIHENWKGSQFLLTKGLGHSLMGKVVHEKIRDFLEEKA